MDYRFAEVVVRRRSTGNLEVVLTTVGKEGYSRFRSVQTLARADVHKALGAEIAASSKHHSDHIQRMVAEDKAMADSQAVE